MYLLICGIILVALYVWYWKTWLTEPAGAPPIVKLYGTRYSAFWLTCTDPGRLIKEAHEKYGPIFTLDLIFLKQTIITDADGFAFVYKAKEAALSFYTVIKYLKGMLGDESTKDRPIHDHIERADKVQMTLMKNKKTFYSYIQEEVEEWAAELATRGEPFDFVTEADRLLMRINVHCFVGKEVRKQYADTFIKLYDELETKGMAIGTFFFHWLPFGTGARCRAIRKEIEDILEPIIDERRRRYAETGEEQVDYLNDYITQPHKRTKEPWTRTEMVERTLAIFFAARINTMKTLFWTMMSLSVRPTVVEKLRSILDEHDDISFEMVERDLDYVDQVMRETVRPMFAINPGARVSMEPLPYKGHIIPKGYVVGASAYVVNRDPKIYPEPEKFIPERWAPGGELRSNPNIWAFFGMGQHRCRGEKFAHLLVRTAIATVFKKYDFKWMDMKEEGQLPPYKFTVALPTPTVPIRALLTPRNATN